MKNKLLLLGLFIMLLSGYASALQSSYMFVSLSYGRGWWPWVCFNEKGVKGVGEPYNTCGARGCPFEDGIMWGVDCYDYGKLDISLCQEFLHDDKKYAECMENVSNNTANFDELMPPAWGLVVKTTISSDIKLVAADNSVVGDELCVGDSFIPVVSAKKGEYWQDGGHDDSPPIYWVDDVEAVVKKIMDYNEKTVSKKEDMCMQEGVPDGFIDPLTGIPIYNMPISTIYQGVPITFAGSYICSMKPSGNAGSGGYEVTSKKDIEYKVDYPVECMYYYYGGSGGGYGSPGWGWGSSDCKFFLLKVPTVIQAGPEATAGDWGTHNVDFESIDDFFKVGEINYSKTIKVVDPAHASLELSAPGFDSFKYGEQNTLRIILKNSGDADLVLRHLTSNVEYKLISCDSETITAGTQAECLLSVVPVKGKGLEVKAEYKYKSCGRNVLANASLRLTDYKDITPVASAQAYGFDVYGDCSNSYFGCEAPSKEGTFVAGYRCFNKDGKYHVPSVERFDLKYDLSPIPPGKEILGARLYLNVKTANKAQTITVYSSTNDKWEPTGCVPGGDICSQPWCKECLPLYDYAGKQEASVDIAAVGEYSLDVSDYVKGVIDKGGKYASFQLTGQEDEWSTEGEKTCAVPGEWTSRDVEFYAAGSKGPYLEVVYR